MNRAKNAFLKSKNNKIPPGYSFGLSNQYVDDYNNPLPIRGSSYSFSISQKNNEPAKVHIETARTSPQGIIRHKKNFEIDRKQRMKYKPKPALKHVSWNLHNSDDNSDDNIDDYSEEDSMDDSLDEMRNEINEEMKDSIEYSDDPEIEEAEEAIDDLTKKLRKAGFSNAKIDLVRKMIFDVLE